MADRRKARDFGARAEEEAARHYNRLGFEVVERNFRTRAGEVDLIVRRGVLLVFVEVKARSREDYGTAADAVHATKRRRLLEVAAAYLARLGARADRLTVRFDAILVRPSGAGALEVECIPGAFESE